MFISYRIYLLAVLFIIYHIGASDKEIIIVSLGMKYEHMTNNQDYRKTKFLI
jgi:hypothetical protein